ncbi:SIS domain-containing protein [Qipengyuania sp. MTN3-11]|uniref:SIS domain-containing protein n=1 Tax=Qipengyuania sp. MTN3-11 TaxID=3056557 RepID=UPI0036F333DA
MSETSSLSSRMFLEAAQAPERVALQRERNRDAVQKAAKRIRMLDPPFAITIARGSSDHAAGFAKHLFETRLRIPVLSQPPSLATLFDATSPKLKGTLAIAISQSGRSPDLIESAAAASAAGALVVALVNDETSPLARQADILLPLHAGEETSVAATKSYIASLVAIADLVAAVQIDDRLERALNELAPVLQRAWNADWSAALEPLTQIERLLVLGRGATLPIAAEAALKFKEVARIHGEAFSSAEVAHGPMALVREGEPIFAFTPSDAAREGFADRLTALAERGATIIGTGCEDCAIPLQSANSSDPAVDAIASIQSFYRFVESLARKRRLDPDRPPHLSKVTRTR